MRSLVEKKSKLLKTSLRCKSHYFEFLEFLLCILTSNLYNFLFRIKIQVAHTCIKKKIIYKNSVKFNRKVRAICRFKFITELQLQIRYQCQQNVIATPCLLVFGRAVRFFRITQLICVHACFITQPKHSAEKLAETESSTHHEVTLQRRTASVGPDVPYKITKADQSRETQRHASGAYGDRSDKPSNYEVLKKLHFLQKWTS